MKCIRTFVIGVVFAATVAWSLAADPSVGQPIDLFSGHDLSGWVNVNCAPDTFAVRDGMIVTTGKPRGFLRTDKMYENYVLELDWKHIAKGGNSGLFVHADALPQVGAPYPYAVEVQVMDGDHGSMFGIRGMTVTPLTKPRNRRAMPTEDRAKPAGEWNHYRLVSQDGTLELAVNGAVVTKLKDCSRVKGYIALEAELGECHFRNIRLTPRPSSNPPAGKVAMADYGFTSIFDGLDFAGWKYRDGHKGHWTAKDGVIHYDGKAQGRSNEKDLWTEKEYGDFVLVADWRLPSEPKMKPHPIVLPNGDFVFENGQRKTTPKMDAGDTGIYLRGSRKAQLNIWSQDLGSGEINGYRTDKAMPADVRKSCIPLKKADNPFGQWNRFVATVRGDRVTCVLNGETVIENARLPGMPAKGPIGLQHHGDPGEFRNLFVQEWK
jgi:hypothetical protein